MPSGASGGVQGTGQTYACDLVAGKNLLVMYDRAQVIAARHCGVVKVAHYPLHLHSRQDTIS